MSVIIIHLVRKKKVIVALKIKKKKKRKENFRFINATERNFTKIIKKQKKICFI